VAFGRIALAWAAVAAWLTFLLLGTLMGWPVRSPAGAARGPRVTAAGGLLARVLAP
jgi:energy-converting hydrogenase Eha subunit B